MQPRETRDVHRGTPVAVGTGMRPADLLRTGLLAAAALASVATSPPPPAAPEPDRCDPSSAAALEVLELGPGGWDDGEFEAWANGDTTEIIGGFQGGYMTPVRLHVDAATTPSCVPQLTTVRNAAGAIIATEDAPLATYAELDGSRTTKTVWLIYNDEIPADGDTITVTTEAGGLTITRTLTVGPLPARLVSLSPPSAQISVGTTLEVWAYLDKGVPAPATLTLESSDPTVIQLSSETVQIPTWYSTATFYITAVAPGTATITATFADRSITMDVTVYP